MWPPICEWAGWEPTYTYFPLLYFKYTNVSSCCETYLKYTPKTYFNKKNKYENKYLKLCVG